MMSLKIGNFKGVSNWKPLLCIFFMCPLSCCRFQHKITLMHTAALFPLANRTNFACWMGNLDCALSRERRTPIPMMRSFFYLQILGHILLLWSDNQTATVAVAKTIFNLMWSKCVHVIACNVMRNLLLEMRAKDF